jgi:GT2 family glycosyltransferase
MKIAVGFATANRSEILTGAVLRISDQTRLADQILIAPGKPEDVQEGALGSSRIPISILSSPIGLPAQRNTIIAATDCDVLIFLDDDFVPSPDFVASVEKLFAAVPQVVVATGTVVADGILGRGLEVAEAERILENDAKCSEPLRLVDVHNAYGCNMAFRMAPIRANTLRFDENLPLYAWWEDVDFSRQMAPFGRIVRSTALKGVHLGYKTTGRTPGRRLGYSQVANRIYLARKGTVSWRRAWSGIMRNTLANLVHVWKPEPWVDRRGRLSGNAQAFLDLVRGDITPSKILKL